jgi:predicted nucleic acid-binding Zn ribbon protein
MEDQLITVETYQFLPQAQAAKLQLEGHDIRVFLADAETVNMDWLLGNAIGNIKLQVPADQAERALSLLDDMREKASQRSDREKDETHSECLVCGAEIPEDQSRCPSCGWSYAGEGNGAGPTRPRSDLTSEHAEDQANPQRLELRRVRNFVLVFSLVIGLIFWLVAWLLRLANVW